MSKAETNAVYVRHGHIHSLQVSVWQASISVESVMRQKSILTQTCLFVYTLSLVVNDADVNFKLSPCAYPRQHICCLHIQYTNSDALSCKKRVQKLDANWPSS